MKQVSNAYKTSMKSSLRNRSYAEITLYEIDTTANTDGSWVSNGEQAYSEFDTVDYEYDYTNTYATLELNYWALNGKAVISSNSNTVQSGFVSNKLSTKDGTFETTAVLTREFTTTHTFVGLTLTFDTIYKEWALAVTVNFYLADELQESQTVNVTDSVVVVDAKVASCDKITITFNKTLPYHYPRLERVMYGIQKVFDNTEIVSTKQSHDVDPLTRRLPKETVSFTLLDYEHSYDPDNPTGTYGYLDKNSPVSIRFGYDLPDGTQEWLKADKYRLSGMPTTTNNKATFSGTGLIGSLSGTYYKSQLGNKNFYDIAEDILLDAGLTLTEKGENPWDIDESLKEMYTTAVLPVDTHMNCLQLVAHACRCRLYTDDSNIIHIKPFGVTVKGIYSGTWSDVDHVWYSSYDTLDGGTQKDITYATLELNRWVLNGKNQVIIDDDKYTSEGFIANVLSSADDVAYWTTRKTYLTKVFDVVHDISILTVSFDTILNEYPTFWGVRFYGEGDELIVNKIVRNITASTTTLYVNAPKCKKIIIRQIHGLPGYYPRVSKIAYRETDYSLDFTSIAENSQSISKIDQLKSISVAKYYYTAENDNTSTLFEGTTTETQFHVEFSGLAQDVQISVTGGTLESSTVYGRAADLVLSSGTKTILITGKTLSESSVVVSYPVNKDGEIDKEENPLITNDEMCTALANHVKAYLQMRNTYDATYRGNPELEVGDIIGVQTHYTNETDGLILTDEISFNGSLSGKMKVKGLI